MAQSNDKKHRKFIIKLLKFD